MNLKTFSQWLSMFVVLMVASVSNVFADNKLYIDNFTVKSGSDVEVALNLDNEDAVCGLQASIVLPEGLTVTGCDVTERTAGNTLKGKYPSGSSTVYNIAMFNLDNASYPGTTGAVVKLSLHATPLFEGGEIEVKNIMLSSPASSQVPCEGATATVTVNNTIYIEVDVTSQFANLTDPANWTNINGGKAGTADPGWACPMVDVNGLGQKRVCEYYDGRCDYTGDVLYQTVTGLAAGVYKIELYGAAAFTYGRGFGSTAFTGDLTVDHNDELTNGDKIDPSAEFSTGVTLYAQSEGKTYGGEIPIYYATNFMQNGADVVTLNGVEVGESGAVKIGMSKTSSSTNWHVIQLKSVIALLDADDALAAVVAQAEAIDPDGDYPALAAVVAEYNKKYDTAEEYLAAIDAIEAAIAVVQAAKDAEAAKEIAAPKLGAMKALVESTNVYTAEAYQEYYGQWVEKYEAGTLTMAEAQALQDPSVVAGWHDKNLTVDNFLLSAWDTAPDYPDGNVYYINTWSTEGDNDGSDFHVPFFEYWTGDASSLGERTLTATMEGLDAGEYEVYAWVRVRAKNGYEAPAYGITLSANEGEAVEVIGTQVPETQFYLDYFKAKGVVGEDGVLKIQFNVAADNNISWLSFKNVNYKKVETVEPEVTTYEGMMTITVTHPQAGPMGEFEQEGSVIFTTVPDEGTVDITFPGFTMPVLGTQIPDYTIEDVLATVLADGTVVYAADNFQVAVPMGQMSINYNGTLEGSFAPDATAPTLTVVLQNAMTATIVFAPIAPEPELIANADFMADEPEAVGVRTYAKDIKGEGDKAQAQPVTGWTITENGDARAAGTYAYGSEAFLGGEGYTAPAAGPEGEEGQALGLIGVWSGKVQYTQNVTLAAGEYMLVVPVYNAGGTSALAQNLIGVDETFATTTQYPVGQWTIEQIKFTVEEEKEVTISLGVVAQNVGSGSAEHLFIDKVQILTEEEIAAAELALAKTAALAVVTALPVGTDVFYYDSWDVERATAAIEAAEDIDAVKEAVKTVLAAQIQPYEGVEYIIKNVTAEGTQLAVVSPEGENAGQVALAEDAKVFFTAVEGGYVLSNADGEYIYKTTGNGWTLATTSNIEEAYVLNFNVVEGGYTIQGANGLFGTDNIEAGSAVYADKTIASNGLWTIEEFKVIEIADVSIECDGQYEEEGGIYYFPVTIKYDATIEGLYADEEYGAGLDAVFTVSFYEGEEYLGDIEMNPQNIGDGEFTTYVYGLEFGTEYTAVVSGLTVYDYNKIDWDNWTVDTPIDITDELAQVTFTTAAKPVNYAWTELTDELYHEWDNVNTTEAQIVKDVPNINNYDNKIGQGETASSSVVYGTSTVYEYDYAALADYDVMKITFATAGAAPRLLFNRAAQDDHQGPLFEINNAESPYVTVSEDGLVWIVDLNKIEAENPIAEGFANLNVIKASWGGPVNIVSIELGKEIPELAENIAEYVELDEGSTLGLALNDAQVIAAGDGIYLINDGTGSVFIWDYDELGFEPTVGQKLNGYIVGERYEAEDVLPTMVLTEEDGDISAFTAEDGEVVPQVMTLPEAYTEENELTLVTVEGVTFASEYDEDFEEYTYYIADAEGNEVLLNDLFAIGMEDVENGSQVNITGVPFTMFIDYTAWGGGVYEIPVFFPTAIVPAVPEIAIDVERPIGMGYTVTVAPFDAEEAKELLGVEELTWDMVRIVNPDGTEISDYAPYDGWFNEDGVATTWGSTTKICTKFFQVIENGEFEICDMNGADIAGATYTTKWALVAGDKKVFYNINVTFYKEEVEIAVVDLGIKTSVEYDKADADYAEKQISISDDDVQAILEELGLESLDDATVYGYNPTTQELVASYAGFDGWRDANGDFHMWNADGTVAPACVKYTDGQNYLCYNRNGIEAQTITAYWAIANEEKAVLVEIEFIYTDAEATGIATLDADGPAIEAVYSINGALQQGLQKGLNVVKFANGEIKKVLVK